MPGDVVFPNDTNEKAHVGAEYRLLPEFSLRVGTRINYDNQGLTAGAVMSLRSSTARGGLSSNPVEWK